MNEMFRNPHTFDMSNYYSGNTVVIGGRDFDREEKEAPSKIFRSQKCSEKNTEIDLSFLHLLIQSTPTKRI